MPCSSCGGGGVGGVGYMLPGAEPWMPRHRDNPLFASTEQQQQMQMSVQYWRDRQAQAAAAQRKSSHGCGCGGSCGGSVIEFEIDLTALDRTDAIYIPTGGNDTCSIETYMAPGSVDFATGQISVQKANCKLSDPTDLPTPLALTAPGLVELTGSHWFKTAFLVLKCSTAASSPVRVMGAVCLKHLGYSV